MAPQRMVTASFFQKMVIKQGHLYGSSYFFAFFYSLLVRSHVLYNRALCNFYFCFDNFVY